MRNFGLIGSFLARGDRLGVCSHGIIWSLTLLAWSLRLAEISSAWLSWNTSGKVGLSM